MSMLLYQRVQVYECVIKECENTKCLYGQFCKCDSWFLQVNGLQLVLGMR